VTRLRLRRTIAVPSRLLPLLTNPAISSTGKPQDIVVFSLFLALFYTTKEKHKINSKHGSKHFLLFF